MFELLQNGVDIYRSGGPVMYPLGLLSVVALAIIIERLWILRRTNYLEPGVVHALSGLLGGREYKSADDYCRRHPGPFTELVHTMVENRHAPYDELKEILSDTGRRQLLSLQRGLPALATIVGGAPLLGLLGTVLGMINIFKAVATGGSGINETLATGISQALITTATGLIIAIPALFTHSFLEARAVSILADIEAQMMDFLHLVRRPDVSEGADKEEPDAAR